MDLFDILIAKKLSGNEDVSVDSLSVTENGTYTAEEGHAYSPVSVNVPSAFMSAVDITENGTYVPSGSVSGFNQVIVSVSGGGGDHDAEDAIIQRTISGVYENSRVKLIGEYAFYSCSGLTTVSFPNATSIETHAFCSCSDLTTANFSNVTSIGGCAFAYCKSLTTVSFPNATLIEAQAFCSCSSLTTANFSNVTSIGVSAFAYCKSLTTVSFPNATLIGGSAFAYCKSLTTANFSNVTSIGVYAFYSCSGLTTVSFPNATSIGGYAFTYCLGLTTVSFPMATSFGTQCFRSCTQLESFYILASSVATLGGSAFLSTPMWLSSYLGHFGSIYVPASLVSAYKSAANWRSYADRITSYVE